MCEMKIETMQKTKEKSRYLFERDQIFGIYLHYYYRMEYKMTSSCHRSVSCSSKVIEFDYDDILDFKYIYRIFVFKIYKLISITIGKGMK